MFDDIHSLSEVSILEELNKNFSNQEVNILVKSQCVPYSTDFPDASITKLIQFIEESNESKSILKNVTIH